MLVDLPFIHETTVLPPRHRHPVRRLAVSMATFEVPEVARGDVRRVLDWTAHEHGPPHPVVSWEGRLFAPLTSHDPKVAGGVHVTRRRFADEQGMWVSLRRASELLRVLDPLLRDPASGEGLVWPGSDEASATVGTVISDGGEVALAAASARYGASLLCVDGKVWWSHEGVEPSWRVSRAGARVGVTIDTAPVRWWEVAIPGHRRGRALAVQGMILDRGTRGMVTNGSIQVDAPDALTDDVTLLARSLADAARHRHPGTFPSMLMRAEAGGPWSPDGRWSDETKAAARAMKDAIGRGLGSAGDARAVVDAAVAFRSTLPGRVPRSLVQAWQFAERTRVPLGYWRVLLGPRLEAERQAREQAEADDVSGFVP